MNILLLSPHTDDAELGCAGYIMKYPEYDYLNFAFSDCDSELIRDEFETSNKTLYCTRFILGIKRRMFLEKRQYILDKLFKIRNDFDIVFIPSDLDTHQDHQVITQEAIRAFKGYATIIMYFTHNVQNPNPNYFVSLTEEQVNKKIEVLSCYHSQKDRYYFQPDYIRSRLQYFGTPKHKYIEPFHIHSKNS